MKLAKTIKAKSRRTKSFPNWQNYIIDLGLAMLENGTEYASKQQVRQSDPSFEAKLAEVASEHFDFSSSAWKMLREDYEREHFGKPLDWKPRLKRS